MEACADHLRWPRETTARPNYRDSVVHGECREVALKKQRNGEMSACKTTHEGWSPMNLVRLTEPHNVGEQIMLQSLLEGSGIAYLIRNANVSSLYPGLPCLTSHVMVEERDYPRAEAILQRLRLDVREVTGEMGG